jgi:hypothetical protein
MPHIQDFCALAEAPCHSIIIRRQLQGFFCQRQWNEPIEDYDPTEDSWYDEWLK